jgi:predicted GH43/DUF377 family glycosyl hydrolase
VLPSSARPITICEVRATRKSDFSNRKAIFMKKKALLIRPWVLAVYKPLIEIDSGNEETNIKFEMKVELRNEVLRLVRFRSCVLILFLLFLLVPNSLTDSDFFSSRHKIVKDGNNRYFLIYAKKGYSKIIPNEGTVKLLGIDPTTVPLANSTIFKQYPHKERFIAEITWDSAPDIQTEALLERIFILSPPLFWKKTYYLPDMFNPTIQYWLNKPLLAYRAQMYDSSIEFEWFSFHRDTEFSFHSHKDDYGLRYGSQLKVTQYDFNQMTEDPRLFVRNNTSLLLVLYTCKASLFSPPKPCYFHMNLTRHPTTHQKLIQFTESTVIDDHPFERAQKNWIPIEDQNNLYFIQSINPYHLLLHNETSKPEQHIGKAYLVYKREEIALPWSSDYGLPIRGGTPTHLLTGLDTLMMSNKDGSNDSKEKEESNGKRTFPSSLRLAFFHSVSGFHGSSPPIRTYFMGAITFCPNYPFHIYSMSSHPILLRKFYEGKWADPPKIDFVMFPIGIFERPEQEELQEQEQQGEVGEGNTDHQEGDENAGYVSDDDEEKQQQQQEERQKKKEKQNTRYIWFTFGYADKNGGMAKLDLKELLESLEVIGEC